MENNNNENPPSALARQVQNNLEKAEKEFHALKEKYFGDKINELESEIEALNNGTHQGFLLKCTELEEAKAHRLMIAHKLRELQIQNIENEFLFEKKQTDEQHASDLSDLKGQMLKSAEMKISHLTKEKEDTVQLILKDREGLGKLVAKRNQDKVNGSDSKRARYSSPHFNVVLRDSEIDEDLRLIQKGEANLPYNSIVINKNTRKGPLLW